MSVGDGVAVGDYNGDGLQDMFFTNVLKRDIDRNALYINKGDFKFERVPLPMIEKNCEYRKIWCSIKRYVCRYR